MRRALYVTLDISKTPVISSEVHGHFFYVLSQSIWCIDFIGTLLKFNFNVC